MLRRGAEVCGRRATLDAEISKGRPSTPANTPWANTSTKPDLVLRRITRSWHEPRKTAEGSRLRLHLHREQTSPHIVLDSLRWWSQHSLGKVKRVGLVKLVTVRSPCVRGIGELKSATPYLLKLGSLPAVIIGASHAIAGATPAMFGRPQRLQLARAGLKKIIPTRSLL